MLEGMSEGECVVASLVVSLMLTSIVVLVVAHVFAATLPTFVFFLLSDLLLNFGVVKDFHSFIIKTLWLDHV